MSNLDRDRALIEGIGKGDRGAVEDLYRAYFPMVHSLVTHNSGDADEAADVFQETAIVVFEKARLGGFELQSLLKTYMYSVARRLWLKRLQQKQRSLARIADSEDLVAVDEDIERHLQHQEDFNLMDASLAKIGEPCKSLLQSYYLQKKSMTEIAAGFGYTNADNAKTQKYKCLVRLKKLFFAEYKKRD